MLNNTSSLPPKPVHNVAKRALVVHPAHVALKVCLQEGQLLTAPKGTKNIQGVGKAVLGHGVVVL